MAVVRGEVAYPERAHRRRSRARRDCGSPTCCRREGGRVSAHYGATTTIGADRSGEIVLTGAARDVDVRVAALCRRPDATGSIVDPTNARIFSRTP